jgi:Flp pilus assembly pilin Flp
MVWQSSASREKRRERPLLEDFKTDERAATSIEYALIAVLLAGCLFIALPLVSGELAETFTLLAGYLAAILAG